MKVCVGPSRGTTGILVVARWASPTLGSLRRGAYVAISIKEDGSMTSGECGSGSAEDREAGRGGAAYQLRLFVAGMGRQSQQAIRDTRALCEDQLRGDYELEVIDVYQNPDSARLHQPLAVPALLKAMPPPLKKIIGDFSQKERVLAGLDLHLRGV